MKKILIILLAIAFNVFAQGEGDRIVNPTWKLSSGALSPTVSAWTLTLPATTFSPSIVTPLIIGGADTISTLTYKTTTGVGKTGARHIFLVGNNGATEAMTILNSGFVGIGTPAPSSLFHVFGVAKFGNPLSTSGLYIYLTTRLADATGIFLQSGDNSYVAINRPASTNHLAFATGDGGEKVRIDNVGNLGLGTATPYAQYSQVGATPIWYATDSDVNKSRTTLATATDTSAIKIDASVAQPIITFKNATGGGFTLSTVAAGGASFDGNVGIGTASPDQKLEVFNGNIRIGDDANTARKLELERNSVIIGGLTTDGANMNLVAQNDKNVNIWDDTNNGLTVKNGGNVGIGTATPLHKLSGYSTTATNLNAFNFINNTINKVTSTVAEAIDTSSFSLNFSSLGSPKLRLKGKTGNSMIYVDSVGVGIGTPSPSALLGVGASNQFTVNSSGGVAGSSFSGASFTATNVLQTTSGVLTVSDNQILKLQSRNFTIAGGGGIQVQAALGTFSNTSGASIGMGIIPVYNQSGGTSVVNTDLLINRTETSLGTTPGNQFLIDAQVGGTSKFIINNQGALTIAGAFTGSALTRGSDAFDTTAVTDTVTISGAEIGDYYTITLTGSAAPTAADAIRLQKTGTGFVLWRSASGISGLTYDWFRQK